MRMKTHVFIIILSLFTFGIQAQNKSYRQVEQLKTDYPSYVFTVNDNSFKAEIEQASKTTNKSLSTIKVPTPNGEVIELQVIEDPVLHPDLQARFPEIKSYKAIGENISGRIGYTYKGLHGMLFTPKGTIYIDPYEHNKKNATYKSYYRKDYQNFYQDKGHYCLVNEEKAPIPHRTNSKSSKRGRRASGNQLRKYRLALACTGEYAQYHGGTTSGVLSAMTVTMNRVNGVYTRDFAIKMEIIGNNDQIIYLNSSTDPYNNFNAGQLIGQNQQNINNVIGVSNYDIGHVFSTGGGGLASRGSVCSSTRKASGVTGRNAPVGDPFDIDYVAHEMGHQFGGNHTQNNSCNRASIAAYEPGSASTIMGYAGICSPNLQNNSDDYFHTHSYDEITDYAHSGFGNTCAVRTNTGNTAPQVTVPNGGFEIPKETPFVLTGSATDVNGDNLTYCWEQMDLGPSGHPNSPSGDAPIFRSFDPKNNGSRTFPRLASVINGNTVLGETYATYTRNLNFRLTVRDNNNAGGGVNYNSISFKVDGNSGPFTVTSPNAGQQVEGGNGFVVKWNVANTDQAPVNCKKVNIYLSNDLGYTYFDTLATNVPNTGSASVVMPQVTGPTHRIRVQAADNIFFNLNPGNFTMVSPKPLNSNATINLTANLNWPQKAVTLNWNDQFNNESYFVIERSLNNNSNFVIIDSVGADITTYVDNSAAINSTSNHYYKVYAINAVGSSSKSNEATYQPSSVNELNLEQALNFYPNPAKDQLNINFKEPIQSEMELKVIDVTNKTLHSFTMKKGNQFQQVDISHLATGSYWIIATNKDNQQGSLPFQVIK